MAQLPVCDENCIKQLMHFQVPCLGVKEDLTDVVYRALDSTLMTKSFTLMMPVPSTLPFLDPKVTYSLCDRGMRLDKYFLSLIMCHEQLKSMSHLSSRPPSSTYIG
jgi:hypothetical protein